MKSGTEWASLTISINAHILNSSLEATLARSDQGNQGLDLARSDQGDPSIQRTGTQLTKAAM